MKYQKEGPPQDITVIYDDQCPVCRGYCTRIQAGDPAVRITTVDARQQGALMADITARGWDIDEGMVVQVGDQLFYGQEAAYQLAQYTDKRGMTGWIDRIFFATRWQSAVMYPVGKAVRNMLLRLLHIPKINNLRRK